ncbi:MAG: stage II sporulation protein M [Phenylobacterium sp.]
MPDLILKSQRFRAEREADWKRLESLLAKAERSAGRLSREELLELPVLYRQALSSLSVARSISLDQGLIDYLESLSTRAYFFVYGARSTLLERIGRFFARDWALSVQSLWRETLAAAGVMALGIAVAYLLFGQNPEWFYAFVPEGMAGGRDPMASTAALRETLYSDKGEAWLSVFAAFLFTNNAQVSLFAFALGFALCVPTAAVLLYNGLTAGAMIALFASHGLAFEFVGWLMIHGVTELFAIALSGAAGFRIGWSIIFPGERPRIEAAAQAGRTAATVMAGVVIMLMIAGVLEGIGRQTINADVARYAIAAVSLVVWLAFFYAPRKPA